MRLACFLCALLAAVPGDGFDAMNEVKRLKVPESLMPKGKQPLLMVRAEGVQIYKFVQQGDEAGWISVAPKADLLDYRTAEKVGSHGEGPSWTHREGGTVAGKFIAKEKSPNRDAIDWLLLEAKSASGPPFAKVTHIQRIDTWGGLPPGGPGKVGEVREVRYHATYVFWGDR
jgi:hypothetical protein